MTVKDFKKENGEWATREYYGRHTPKTLSYQRFQDMHRRCKPGTSAQERGPRYKGCSVDPRWSTFQDYMKWAETQVGFDTPGYHLDKDLLVDGNRVYGPDTCLFLPRQLNSFFITMHVCKGEYPRGVCWDNFYGMFRAQCRVSDKVEQLGLFTNPSDAYQAYKIAKEGEARRWAQRLIDKEFLVEQKVIDKMLAWTLPDNPA